MSSRQSTDACLCAVYIHKKMLVEMTEISVIQALRVMIMQFISNIDLQVLDGMAAACSDD